MACPKESRVLIPAGTYRISSLFLKDDVSIELDEGAVLSAFTDRSRFPVFKGMIQSYNERMSTIWVPGREILFLCLQLLLQE